MRDHDKRLTKEEIRIVRIYIDKLDEFRVNEFGKKPVIWTDEELSRITSNMKLIQMFGAGDPVKAAERHKQLWLDIKNAVAQSAGDQSTQIH